MKKIKILISLTLVLLLCAACSTSSVKRELNELAIVLAIGIDKGETDAGKIDVVTQIAQVGSAGKSSGQSGGGGESSGESGSQGGGSGSGESSGGGQGGGESGSQGGGESSGGSQGGGQGGGESGGQGGGSGSGESGGESGGGGDSSGGEKSESSGQVWNLAMHGDDIFSILRNALRTSSRKLYISHNQLLIFGQEQAKEGIGEHIDWFVRDHETRLTTLLLVSKGRSSEVLKAESPLDGIPAQRITKMVYTQQQASQAPVVTIFDFISDSFKKGIAPMAPIIGVDENGELFIEGAAVFNEGKMIGELSPEEVRGFLWCKNDVKSCVFTVENDEKTASIEVMKANADFKVDVSEDNNIKIDVKVKMQGVVNHVTGYPDLANEEVLLKFQREAEKRICSEVEAAFNKASELEADIFGIQEYLFTRKYAQWERCSFYKLMSNLELNVKCDVLLTRTGSIIDPVPVEKES